ncbi:type II toxin-antitoxin system RelE/ParE family toxin [Cryobacterium sp. CG_9.6]|uniref:type II toxin-antitoxin system RelE family toxin n=1 Tax=Cryobacterium sp. CG_9.6 TaxID=2760710 RepID=UPI0024755975|nr:type II toxin-antitoxin system RelE/ParE family toxin [Cryobacterium sp. CG_9.6]MDH6237120.1 mRNA interferase RelE/StbE [Cryobacterium sp. CG_9.6]
MSTYRIEVRPAALKALRSIHPTEQARIRGAIALLGEDPRPPGAKALQGRPGFRVRVGNYRIIYTLDEGVLLVVVVTLGHRSDVYDV